MKTPSASKHRLAGRNLPKLDRYNGYSHQDSGARIRRTWNPRYMDTSHKKVLIINNFNRKFTIVNVYVFDHFEKQ